MKAFLTSRLGLACVLGFVCVMGFALHRVNERRRVRASVPMPLEAKGNTSPKVTAPPGPIPGSGSTSAERRVAENARFLEGYYGLEKRVRQEHDRVGNPVTRRENANTPSDAGRTTAAPVAVQETAGAVPVRDSLRLSGTPSARRSRGRVALDDEGLKSPSPPPADAPVPLPATSVSAGQSPRPKRFNPYGRVIKCELVFTIDSTNEQTPLVSLVMEPVYNNGQLVIPAGAELHGIARPDRLRDRLFSGQEWILVFPREDGRPNGRQLTVRGVALDRIEPDANGMTWGMTDGAYGLAGKVIRTLEDQEIKRFVATFFAAASVALQDRQSEWRGQGSIRSTPQNAVLQGLAANFQKMAEDVAAEITRHGVFIRVPAGHQFYFYPMQIIDPDVADISPDIAKVQ